MNRREFLGTAALGAGAAAAAACAPGAPAAAGNAAANDLPETIRALTPMTAGVVPIADDERLARIAKAQKLMAEQKIDAVFMEGTTSCFYFANMRWGQSERTFGLVIPARGEVAYVCPGFEEDRARELIKFGSEVRTWEEHESPYALIAGIVKDRGVQHHRIAMEERVRFFIADGVRKAAPGFEIVDATPVTAGCRVYKSPAEIALMQRAHNATIAAYRAAFATMTEGMTQGELSANIAAAFRQLGFSGGASVQVGKWSALPHGSITPQQIREGDIVMVDGGTTCEGYASDITRTTVFGKPTARQLDVWQQEKAAQTAAFEAMKLGAPCETVDAAARASIEAAGFGPGYKLPGLPHRTGHGIGLDGHEWTNFVKGNTTPMAPGMCFSDEPMIAIPGEFGIRLEDCVYFDEAGPHFFTKQAVAIDQPFG
jgi:Xaa-Pro dipeptidase